MEKLSLIDQKVLSFVSLFGINVSERDIAKKLRLSQATVNYSLKKMLDRKIISGFIFRLNYDMLGFGSGAWVFFTLKRKSFDLNVLFEKISGFPQVLLFLALAGEYDFCIRLVGKDQHVLFDTIQAIEEAISSFIDESNVVFVSKTIKCHQIVVPEKNSLKELDAVSKKILSFRMENPSFGIKEVCSALKLHRNTVGSKWRSLFENNFILKKGVLLDAEAQEQLGFGFKSLVFFNVAPGKKDSFAKAMQDFPEVHELFAIAGHHDFLAIIRVKNQRDFFDFHRKLLSKGELNSMIQKTVSRVILISKNINFNQKLLE